MISEYFFYLALCLMCFVSAHSVGYMMIRFLYSNVLPNNLTRVQFLLFYQLIGITFLITFFSIFYNIGNTIQILFLIFFILLFVINKKNTKNKTVAYENKTHLNFKNGYIFWLSFSAIYLLLYTVLFFNVYNLDGTTTSTFRDHAFYSKVAFDLLELDRENLSISMNHYLNLEGKFSMYHYSDLWLTALFTKVFGINSFYTYVLITSPYLSVLAVIGFSSAINSVMENEKAVLLLGFLSMGMSSLVFPFEVTGIIDVKMNPIVELFAYASRVNSLTGSKLAFMIINFSAFVVLYSNKRRTLSFCFIANLFLYNPTTIVGVAGTLFAHVLYMKTIEKRWPILTMVYSGSLFALFFLFYAIKSSLYNGDEVVGMKLFPLFTSVKYVFTPYIRATMIVFGLVAVPALALAVAYTNQGLKSKIVEGFYRYKEIAWVVLFTYAIICFGYMFLYTKNADAVQVLCMYMLPFLRVLVSVLLIYLFVEASGKRMKAVSLGAFMFITAPYLLNHLGKIASHSVSHSTAYLNQVERQVKEKNLERGAFVQNREQLTAFWDLNLQVEILGKYLVRMKNGIDMVSIGDYNRKPITHPLEKSLYRILERNYIFTRFVESQQQQKAFSSIEQSQVNFIEEKGIEFVIRAENAPMNAEIEAVADTIIVDDLSGEKFIVLKNGSMGEVAN